MAVDAHIAVIAMTVGFFFIAVHASRLVCFKGGRCWHSGRFLFGWQGIPLLTLKPLLSQTGRGNGLVAGLG